VVAAHSDDAIYTGLALLQTQRPVPARGGLPARADRRLRRHLAAGQPRLGVHRPGPAGRLRPVQRAGPGRRGLRCLRPAGRGRRGGGRRPHPRVRGQVHRLRPDREADRQLGNLNVPWGLAIALGSFGKYAGALLVGNFGDGKIGAYTDGGEYLGFLRDRDNDIIAIDGLWALLPGLTRNDDHRARGSVLLNAAINSRSRRRRTRSAHLALKDHQLVAKHHDLDVTEPATSRTRRRNKRYASAKSMDGASYEQGRPILQTHWRGDDQWFVCPSCMLSCSARIRTRRAHPKRGVGVVLRGSATAARSPSRR
jgi:hypothetical protein